VLEPAADDRLVAAAPAVALCVIFGAAADSPLAGSHGFLREP
jgi:hypothetical protein